MPHFDEMCFNLDQSKIWSSGNGLIIYMRALKTLICCREIGFNRFYCLRFCTKYNTQFSKYRSVSNEIFDWGFLYLLVGKVGGTKTEMEVQEF